jgi:hypothetical protein
MDSSGVQAREFSSALDMSWSKNFFVYWQASKVKPSLRLHFVVFHFIFVGSKYRFSQAFT